MLQSSERYNYCLVFFKPRGGYVYHRATTEAQTNYETIIVDETGISPPFEHHCHPYFAIWNAIPKFREHKATLSRQQSLMHEQIELLMDVWTAYHKQVEIGGLDLPKKVGGTPVDGAMEHNKSDSDGDSQGSAYLKVLKH